MRRESAKPQRVPLKYEDVLKRPKQREVSGLTLAQVDTALAALAAVVEPVEVRFAWRPQLADPGDEMLPASIKAAAARLAKEDGVSLNQWIASAAQKVGAVETAAECFRRRAGNAQPEDLCAVLALVPDRSPTLAMNCHPAGNCTDERGVLPPSPAQQAGFRLWNASA